MGFKPPPPKQKYSPPNEMKPNSPFGLGLMFFARFVSKQISAKGLGLMFFARFVSKQFFRSGRNINSADICLSPPPPI